MKILLIGATGLTGQLLLPLLLDAGHAVTVMVRKPEAFSHGRGQLRVVPGDVRDPDALLAAVQGQEAVISTYGARSLKRGDTHEVFFQNLVSAMKQHGVKRLISLSAWGAGESRATVGVLFNLIRNTLLRHVFDDKNRAEALVDQSDLDYTHVRPGRLLNTAARGGVKAALSGEGLQKTMTRADLAHFMASQLADPQWVRKAPIIGY